MIKIACAGDNCVDYYDNTGESFPGGNPVNVSVYVKRLGGQSAYLGAVGTDDFGKQMCAALQEKGVDVSHVQILPGKTAFTHVERINGERVFGDYDEGVMADFRLRQADFDFLKGYNLLVTGLWGHTESQLAYVRAMGIPVAFDGAERPLDEAGRIALPHVNVAFFSDDASDEESLKARILEIAALGPQIVVATPGRLSDHMKRRTVRLDRVQTVVLDEADRMLDMGFIHDVTRILDKIPSRRNLGMFSATISREVMDISWVYQRDPEEITVRADEQNKPDILQYAVTVEQTDKVAAMARIIRQEKLERVMVFCNTKGMVERLTKYLEMEGLDAACIHGDIPQKKREQVMARFRRGELPVFVATDVAARGIDVDDVDAVFNYDVPQENEYYVHRIGRTGRAKRHGVAYTLVADYPSKMRLDAIAKFTGNDVKPAHFEGDTLVVDAK